MGNDAPSRRKGKRLLVASVGVATVSFLAVQSGCEEQQTMTNVANLLSPPDFGNAVAGDAAADAAQTAPTDSGNQAPLDARYTIATSGNLISVPGDAALDAARNAADAAQDAQTHDAKSDAWTPPSSGNLVPVPPAGDR
jgi:hypothetical protein